MAKNKSVNLTVGRGEKRSVKQGGGLTAKGRAKYNRATGSKLKAPVTGKVKAGSKAGELDLFRHMAIEDEDGDGPKVVKA